MIWLGVLIILLMAAIGAPLFSVLLAASMLGFYSADIELAIVAIELYRIVDTPLLVALPLLKQARLRSKRAEIAFVQHEIVNPVQSALRAVELAGVQGRRKSEIDSDMAAYVKEGNRSQG